MDLAQALEQANAYTLPGFLTTDAALTSEREKNEQAIALLMDEWWKAPLGKEPFPFSLVLGLADRNREVCDEYGTERLDGVAGTSLSRRLSDDDLVAGVAALQHRSPEEVRRVAGPGLNDLGVAYVEAPVSGMICGIDLETTERYPDRGYIINVGMEFVRLAPKGRAERGYAQYCGIPRMYEQKGVPLSRVHHITWADLKGKRPFRENRKLQEALLARENEDGKIKISLRARDPLTVDGVAAELGGGGHPRAAGISMEGDLDACTAKVVEKMAERLKQSE